MHVRGDTRLRGRPCSGQQTAREPAHPPWRERQSGAEAPRPQERGGDPRHLLPPLARLRGPHPRGGRRGPGPGGRQTRRGGGAVSACAPIVHAPGRATSRVQVSRGVQGESACKPASVPRGESRGGGHPSGTGVAAGLVRSTRGLGRASLRAASPRPCVPYSTLLRVGFTEPAGHPAAGALLPHRFTLTAPRTGRRSALCGTVLRVAPTGC
jgi:hypothetical protein